MLSKTTPLKFNSIGVPNKLVNNEFNNSNTLPVYFFRSISIIIVKFFLDHFFIKGIPIINSPLFVLPVVDNSLTVTLCPPIRNPPLITFFAVLRCLRTDRTLRFAFFETRRSRCCRRLTRRFVRTCDGMRKLKFE